MKVNRSKVDLLMEKGVKIPNPESVDIGHGVDIERISGENVWIYSGCKIYGESTLLMNNTRLGYEAPVTIENCQTGSHVELKGGFFKDAVFLNKSSAGSGAHVRDGTILEEEASIAHTVGLKQTILFPFVTLGSLINFCDCFMAGGTSRKNHSEVGSAYIHFNFTPNQDKATPSLIGDVPHGVMLDQPPIFLGGQGGLVGPSRLAYGTTIAAGAIYRKDALKPSRILFEGPGKAGNIPFLPGLYRGVKRIVVNNLLYIGNLLALLQWYAHVRTLFISDGFPEELHTSLVKKLHMVIDERIIRFVDLAEKMPVSIEYHLSKLQKDPSSKALMQQKELYEKRTDVRERLRLMVADRGDIEARDLFLKDVALAIQNRGNDYIPVIRSLSPETKKDGIDWLQGVVDKTLSNILNILINFK